MSSLRSVLLAGAGLLLASFLGSAQAENIDFTHITIVGNAAPFNASFDVSNIATNNAALPSTDGFGYASQGGGVDTYVDFEFDQPYEFTGVTLVDRLHSGAAVDALGGYLDYVTEYDIILSTNSTFGDGDDVTVSVGPLAVPEQPATSMADFTSNATIPNVTAQYIRYDVTGVNPPGANPGAHTLLFDVVPEPTTLAGLAAGLGIMCVFARRRALNAR